MDAAAKRIMRRISNGLSYIDCLPTLNHMRKGMLSVVLYNGKVVHCQVDISNLRLQDKRQLLDNVLKFVDDDNEKFLHNST